MKCNISTCSFSIAANKCACVSAHKGLQPVGVWYINSRPRVVVYGVHAAVAAVCQPREGCSTVHKVVVAVCVECQPSDGCSRVHKVVAVCASPEVAVLQFMK